MNLICPICNISMTHIVDDVFFCKKDCLYLCHDHQPADYNADYLLHYKLYGRTQFGKQLNQKRWSFILDNGLFGPLLDFGCGSDSFADAKPKDVAVFSYDPYYKKDFSFLNVELDTTTFWDSFEHLTRLEIVPLLNSRQIILSIPILRKDVDIFCWKHFRPGEHIWYFSEDALINLFKKWGYILKCCDTFETVMGRDDIKSYCFILSEVSI